MSQKWMQNVLKNIPISPISSFTAEILENIWLVAVHLDPFGSYEAAAWMDNECDYVGN